MLADAALTDTEALPPEQFTLPFSSEAIVHSARETDAFPTPTALKVITAEEFLFVYDSEKDTFLFYPVDITLKEPYNFLKRILPIMKKKCKKIITIRMDV